MLSIGPISRFSACLSSVRHLQSVYLVHSHPRTLATTFSARSARLSSAVSPKHIPFVYSVTSFGSWLGGVNFVAYASPVSNR